MAPKGYTAVTDSGFIGMSSELDQGAWGEIVTKKWEAAHSSELLDAPTPVFLKVTLKSAIARLLLALGATTLAELDADWDDTQRQAFYLIGAARNSKDKAVRAAGDRLAKGLLPASGGTEQTNYGLDAEVDFGAKQIALAGPKGPLHADVEKAGLHEVMKEIQKTTEALAEALGRGGGQKRKAPSVQLREAMSRCVTAFNMVHQALETLLADAPKGVGRDRIALLLEPLDALLSRAVPTSSGIQSETTVAVAEDVPEGKVPPADKPA